MKKYVLVTSDDVEYKVKHATDYGIDEDGYLHFFDVDDTVTFTVAAYSWKFVYEK